MHKKNPPAWAEGFRNNELAMTYSHMGDPTLPSALRGFTSEFGKGSGGSLLLWSPAQLVCLLAMVLFTLLALRLPSFLQIECINRCIWVAVVCSISLTKSRLRLIVRSIWNQLMLYIQLLGCCIVKPHEQLVLVSFMHHCTSTSNLSTS